MNIVIETERLRIRPLKEDDLEGMFALDSDPEVHKYLGNKPVKTKAESLKIIQDIQKQYQERGIGRWAVEDKNTNTFLGWSGLRLYKGEDEEYNGFSNFYDIGYRFIKEFWGKGYATESAKACLEYAFHTMHLDVVYGLTELGNEASHNVLLKIGLQYKEQFYCKRLDEELRWYEIKKQ